MMQYKDLVEECEREIRAGHMGRVAVRLRQINTAQVPREWRLPLANLCRRAGLIATGTKLLLPVVRPLRSHQEAKATSAERAEYGVLLHRCGALSESLEVLGQVNAHEAPEALLYKVFCFFNRWEYEAALPVLEEYLKLPITPYMKIVGSLNYASALVTTGQSKEALSRIDQIVATTREQGFARLQGNSHELKAQVHLHMGEYGKAREELDEASRLLGEAGVAFDGFLVRKWQAILAALEDRQSEKLVALREEAFSRNEWEAGREADRYLLSVEFDEQTFRHLLFGTPFPAYREMILRELGRPAPEGCYVLGAAEAPRLNLASGRIEPEIFSPPKRKCLEVIEILTRDFYRQQRVGGLFSELFKANISTSSPLRDASAS